MKTKHQSNKPFHFKQFSLNHHKSTMKVGTDAILLGVWCDVNNAETILDVGTGSGIIALLMATRSKAKVDAVELDLESVREAMINFNNSPYSKRLHIFHDDLTNFAESTNHIYDIIISNPPFFSNDLMPDNPSRKAARHIDKLTHENLCKGVSKLLSKNSKFCLVIPKNQSHDFILCADKHNMNLHKQQIIYPKPNTLANRVNLEFRFEKISKVITEEMIIRNENGEHSEQYKKYTGDFQVKL